MEHVAPIQLAIRLLVTSGSALLDLPEMRAEVEPFDAASLTWPWRHRDPRVDRLQQDVIHLVGARDCCSRSDVFGGVFDLAAAAAGTSTRLDRRPRKAPAVPRMTEAWYCCAEPDVQLGI